MIERRRTSVAVRRRIDQSGIVSVLPLNVIGRRRRRRQPVGTFAGVITGAGDVPPRGVVCTPVRRRQCRALSQVGVHRIERAIEVHMQRNVASVIARERQERVKVLSIGDFDVTYLIMRMLVLQQLHVVRT